MNRIIATIAALCLCATPAMAQGYVGNWGCKINGVKAGILTIYGEGYGFASTVFGDPSSGTGALTPYTDGVGFVDGPLMTAGGIVAGRIVADVAAGVAVQLESATAIVMLCTPR